jgi:hypothetical protein
MAATVLNSQRAVQMSVYVVRAFARLRQAVAAKAVGVTVACVGRRRPELAHAASCPKVDKFPGMSAFKADELTAHCCLMSGASAP